MDTQKRSKVSQAKIAGLTSMLEMANELGIEKALFWRLSVKFGHLPKPKTPYGNRWYYSQEECEEVRNKVQELRNKGVL